MTCRPQICLNTLKIYVDDLQKHTRFLQHVNTTQTALPRTESGLTETKHFFGMKEDNYSWSSCFVLSAFKKSQPHTRESPDEPETVWRSKDVPGYNSSPGGYLSGPASARQQGSRSYLPGLSGRRLIAPWGATLAFSLAARKLTLPLGSPLPCFRW